MKLVFQADDSFRFPPNQIVAFERNGRKVLCNVDWLIQDYKEQQAELVNVNEIFKWDNTINPEYAMKTDINIPIIIVRFDDGTYEILDGNHRVFRAAYEGKSQIMAHILSEIELKHYVVN